MKNTKRKEQQKLKKSRNSIKKKSITKKEKIPNVLEEMFQLQAPFRSIFGTKKKVTVFGSRIDQFVLFQINYLMYCCENIVMLFQMTNGDVFGSYHSILPTRSMVQKSINDKLNWEDPNIFLFSLAKNGQALTSPVIWKLKNKQLAFISFYKEDTSHFGGFTINSTLRLNSHLNNDFSYISDRPNVCFKANEPITSKNRLVLGRLLIFEVKKNFGDFS